MSEEGEMKKQLWDLYSLTGGKMGVKPPEEELKKWSSEDGIQKAKTAIEKALVVAQE